MVKDIFFLTELFNIIVFSYDIRQNNISKTAVAKVTRYRTILERYIHFDMQNRTKRLSFHYQDNYLSLDNKSDHNITVKLSNFKVTAIEAISLSEFIPCRILIFRY